MIKNRQLHLWIGLLASILILVEAVTGLIMTEPWLIGTSKPSKQQVEISNSQTDSDGWENRMHLDRELSQGTDFRSTSNESLMGFIKGLHSGRIGNTNISILLDIVAIGLIILTITGIILSIKVLKAQRIRRENNN